MAMEKEQLIKLVTKVQQGDNNAMNELFNAFYNDLYYFALKTVKDDDLALDITQEAFVEIINTINKLEEPAAFVTWAKQITYHQCTRYFKKKKDVIVDEDEDGNTVFDNLMEENTDFIPDEALDKDDFKKTILAILDQLSEEQRSAVMMFYFDELSLKQIAEIQCVNENTVKSRLNYARKAIKSAVEEYENKNGIKLHALGCLPLIKWAFSGMFEGGISAAAAETVAGSVTAATGVTVTAGATAATTAAVTTAAATTTASAVGIGAKIAAIPIALKVIAGVVAATVVIGGTSAVIFNQGNNNNQNNNNNNNNEFTSTSPVEELVLEGVIPEGCVYTLHDGTVLKAGDMFPEKCTTGDHVEYGDYYYGYECIYVELEEKYDWYLWKDYFDPIDSGLIDSDVYESWTVVAIDNTKKYYGTIASKINGVDVKNMYATFYYCENMVEAPAIPRSVTAMTASYYNCKSLKKAPVIPKNVKRIMLTFAECTSLEGDVIINATIDKSHYWLYSDTFLHTKNKINLKGATPEEDLILIAKQSDNTNITVNGKKVDYDKKVDTKFQALKSAAWFCSNKYALTALPYFSKPEDITDDQLVWFCLYYGIIDDITKYSFAIDAEGFEYFMVPITVLDNITLNVFAGTKEYSYLNETYCSFSDAWKAYFDKENNAIVYVLMPYGSGGPGGPEVVDYIKISDEKYQVNITWYDPSDEKPTDANADYYELDNYYMVANGYEKMVFEYLGGEWKAVSYSKR